jgi:hypothetical protein
MDIVAIYVGHVIIRALMLCCQERCNYNILSQIILHQNESTASSLYTIQFHIRNVQSSSASTYENETLPQKKQKSLELETE